MHLFCYSLMQFSLQNYVFTLVALLCSVRAQCAVTLWSEHTISLNKDESCTDRDQSFCQIQIFVYIFLGL